MGIELPEEFVNRMRDDLKEEFEDFIASYDNPSACGLRLNMLRTDCVNSQSLLNAERKLGELFGTGQVPWCECGYYYDSLTRPGKHPYHFAGMYYIQEPSAMFVGELVSEAMRRLARGDNAKIRVLDLCAAPGGKTSHIAGYMHNKGLLVANEIIPSRARILSQNVERMGITNCVVTNEAPDALSRKFMGFFDIVVVDTPCSGEGMMRRDEIARAEWSPENVAMCAERGQDILREAAAMLSPGGYLIYSTCTFARAEDEEAVERFMASLDGPDGFEYVDYKPNAVAGSNPADGFVKCCDMPGLFRLWPHRLRGEGHFAAILHKKGKLLSADKSVSEEYAVKKKNRKIDAKAGNNSANAVAMYREFEKDLLKESITAEENGRFELFGDNLYFVPKEMIPMVGLRIERAGLCLGELKKGRFEPSHSLAMAMNLENVRKYINLKCEDLRVMKYLGGEGISVQEGDDIPGENMSGWMLVATDGCPLGLGKISSGIIKNHYPKGLRIR